MRRFIAAALSGCALLSLAFSAHVSAAWQPRIVPRSEWGADESLLLTTAEESKPAENQVPADEGNGIAERMKQCREAQKLYPQEFRAARTVTENAQGTLRWPQSYSPGIRLIVVHHTAQTLRNDPRSPLERMRALYLYHAKTLGWGDIGYHYIIDEDGTIYEGRAGGDNVIGGHAYCANVGTLGIALMGNFEIEEPSQIQILALQWLLKNLTDHYGLDARNTMKFHGESKEVIVGHRDVVSTACPGYFLAGVLDQIRRHVASGDTAARVIFPAPFNENYVDRTDQRRSLRLQTLQIQPTAPTLTVIGDSSLPVRPGGQVTVSLLFRAGGSSVQRHARIASVMRSSPRIGIWQLLDNENTRIRQEIFAPRLLHEGEVETIRLRIQVPEIPQTYSVDIGPVTLTLDAQGRRSRSPVSDPVPMTSTASDRINIPTPGAQRAEKQSSQSSLSSLSSLASPLIRIRLSTKETGAASCSAYDLVSLQKQYRGEVTCAVIAGKAALINEVDLEEYLAGMSEEPDTELYEKQRAFAIAARSYAVFYLDGGHRKFPGMPFDGDDSPARFQAYAGMAAEQANPQWVRAVRATAGQVLTMDGGIVKAAYFSSDDGRTRSPAENGWKDFPFEEVFASKADPWCKGLPMAGHGVGMSGCGAKGQAKEGKTAEQILQYYYPATKIGSLAK
ncbi:MAG: N-acetylmuramoyl-L-alanine amidase [Candidatus Peribacteraceae bacterium]|nr:N-acetylmuramoyl-L-alanine amidase [Candidatus Peribacteraceae bacterium]MDD5741794.1 N-acetylmuramoyl-L-alanine amidase [Candidatus Peribacteraceae bacterium]